MRLRRTATLLTGSTCFVRNNSVVGTEEYVQARVSVTPSSNGPGTISERGLKNSPNNPDVDTRSGMTGRDLRAPVLNMRNEPLMVTVKWT